MPDNIHAPRPLAPDFASHPDIAISDVAIGDDGFLHVAWLDGLTFPCHALFLRENEVTPGVIDHVTRERSVEIDQFPSDLALAQAEQRDPDTIDVTFSDAHTGHFSSGWLRSLAEGRWRPDYDIPDQQLWQAADMPAPPSFDGTAILTDDAVLTDWLRAAWTFGFARLRGCPTEEGSVRRIGERIGTVRSSNFGFTFSVETKPNPDSTAYTSVALDAHTDLASRELQPGLQMLLCRENSATGGASTMVDGFAVAEAMRREDRDAFDALTTLRWVFTNRHVDTDYRYAGPMIETDASGRVIEVRNTGFLRFYPDMAPEQMSRAYRAAQIFNAHCRSDRFLCKTPFEPGDLILFDNRRLLHGRDSFNPQSGIRRLEGCYLDRDEIFSRLRILARTASAT